MINTWILDFYTTCHSVHVWVCAWACLCVCVYRCVRVCVCIVFHVARLSCPAQLAAGPSITNWGAFHSNPHLVHLIRPLLVNQAHGRCHRRHHGSLSSHVSFMGTLMHYLDNNVGGSHAGSAGPGEITREVIGLWPCCMGVQATTTCGAVLIVKSNIGVPMGRLRALLL